VNVAEQTQRVHHPRLCASRTRSHHSWSGLLPSLTCKSCNSRTLSSLHHHIHLSLVHNSSPQHEAWLYRLGFIYTPPGFMFIPILLLFPFPFLFLPVDPFSHGQEAPIPWRSYPVLIQAFPFIHFASFSLPNIIDILALPFPSPFLLDFGTCFYFLRIYQYPHFAVCCLLLAFYFLNHSWRLCPASWLVNVYVCPLGRDLSINSWRFCAWTFLLL
jgi:hypothetical protein